MQKHRITIRNLDTSIEGSSESTILESLLEQSIDYPHGCVSGLCSLCKSRLIAGEVAPLDYFDSALTEEERAAGLILPCRSMPLADCVISSVQHDANMPPVRTLNGAVAALHAL